MKHTTTHLDRYRSLPAEPQTFRQLVTLWGTTNPWPTLRFLLDAGMMRYRATGRSRPAFVYYRAEG